MTYPRPQTILSLLALMVAGLAGNYFGTPIFFGIEFLFGSIFSLLAMQLFGYGPGVIAALVISSITFFSHQQPLVIFVMILEVVAVGWLYRRKDLGLVLIDALYWLCLGMPFAYFVGQASPLSPPSSSLLILVFGKTINGISNALLARLIFMAINSRSRETLFPLKEVLFNLLTLFVLIPSFLIMAHENQDGFGIVGQSVRKALKQSSQSMKESLESWLEQKSTRIVHLAWRSGHDFPDMQQGLDFLHSLDPDLNAVGVIDKQALSTAFSPQFDELGQSKFTI